MRSLLAILLGLAVGAAAALGLAVAAYSLVPVQPVPTAPATPTPAAIVATPAPSPTPMPSESASASASQTTSPFPLVGKAAPALVAPGLDGATIDLSAFKGKPVWVVFTGTYCPPCRDEYPLMNGYAARYSNDGLVVLAIHVKEDAATVKPFVTSLNVTFRVALDGDGSRAKAWDAVALPVHYWIDSQGIVRGAALGGIGPDVMTRNLAKILPDVVIGGE